MLGERGVSVGRNNLWCMSHANTNVGEIVYVSVD